VEFGPRFEHGVGGLAPRHKLAPGQSMGLIVLPKLWDDLAPTGKLDQKGSTIKEVRASKSRFKFHVR